MVALVVLVPMAALAALLAQGLATFKAKSAQPPAVAVAGTLTPEPLARMVPLAESSLRGSRKC